MSSAICWRCKKDPGSWSRYNDRTWCDDCIDVALSTFAALVNAGVDVGHLVAAKMDEHVAREIVRALAVPQPRPDRICALSGWTILPDGRCRQHEGRARCTILVPLAVVR